MSFSLGILYFFLDLCHSFYTVGSFFIDKIFLLFKIFSVFVVYKGDSIS